MRCLLDSEENGGGAQLQPDDSQGRGYWHSDHAFVDRYLRWTIARGMNANESRSSTAVWEEWRRVRDPEVYCVQRGADFGIAHTSTFNGFQVKPMGALTGHGGGRDARVGVIDRVNKALTGGFITIYSINRSSVDRP